MVNGPYREPLSELLRKSTFSATKIQAEFTGPHRINYDISISQERIVLKVRVFGDKNIGEIMPIESDGLWYTSILRKNCSKSPHFQRQKWTQTIKIMKVRRIHGEINPSH